MVILEAYTPNLGITSEVARVTGVPEEGVRYFFSLSLAIIAARIHRDIIDVPTRKLFGLVVGLICMFMVFGCDFFHFVITSVVVYGFVKYLPHTKSPIYVFAFVMCYVCFGHYERYSGEAHHAHWSSLEMLLTVKWCSFAYNYSDGQKPLETLNPSQKVRAFKALPSFYDYISYVFFFAGLTTGPGSEYLEYSQFIDLSLFSSEPKSRPPSSSTLPALRHLLFGSACFILLFLHSNFPDKLIASPQFATYSFPYKVFYIIINSEIGFDKYYIVFFYGHAAVIMCGLGYNGRDPANKEKVLYDRLLCVRLIEFKTASDAKNLAGNWNIPVANWLKRYVYVRMLERKIPNAIAMILTFIVSAIWHGFYAGYYLFFGSLAMFAVLGRLNRDYIKPWFIKDYEDRNPEEEKGKKLVWNILAMVMLQAGLDYCVVGFRLLYWRLAVDGWMSIYALPHIGGVILSIMYGVGVIRKPEWLRTKERAKGKDVVAEKVKKEVLEPKVLQTKEDREQRGGEARRK